jgi:hypothetical protein
MMIFRERILWAQSGTHAQSEAGDVVRLGGHCGINHGRQLRGQIPNSFWDVFLVTRHLEC